MTTATSAALAATGLVVMASLLLLAGGASAVTLTLVNRCAETVWPAIQPGAGKEILARGGLQLLPNRATTIRLPAGWSGRVWGRQGCAFDAAGRGKCSTADCGGTLYCNGAGGEPPATLAEITLGVSAPALDFYDDKTSILTCAAGTSYDVTFCQPLAAARQCHGSKVLNVKTLLTWDRAW